MDRVNVSMIAGSAMVLLLITAAVAENGVGLDENVWIAMAMVGSSLPSIISTVPRIRDGPHRFAPLILRREWVATVRQYLVRPEVTARG